jgi:hypothetical protein
MRLDLGTSVRCADGEFGKLADVVVDPAVRRLTHLVVEEEDGHGRRRLVPVTLAGGGEESGIRLACSLAEARELPAVDMLDYLQIGEHPVEDPDWEVGISEMLALPYYQPMDYPGMGLPDYQQGVTVRYDRVPKGEVEIRRKSPVISSDGRGLGHVDGLVVEGGEVTHVVLEHGHLWGKREVAVPIGAVDHVDEEGVVLSITRDDVAKLDRVRVHRWQHGTAPRA